MAESCSSVQNSHISWDDFLSDDLVILHCDIVESSITVKQENANETPTPSKSDESGQNEIDGHSETNLQDELMDFCTNQQNQNTTSKTRRESGRFLSFLLDQGEHRKP